MNSPTLFVPVVTRNGRNALSHGQIGPGAKAGLVFSKGHWRTADGAAEQTAEIELVVKAHFVGDLLHRLERVE